MVRNNLRAMHPKDIFTQEMDSRKPNENLRVGLALQDANAVRRSGDGSGIANLYSMSGSSILVNISAASRFEYSRLFRITALALRSGGMLEACNEDIAIFTFAREGILEFMENLGDHLSIVKTVVSPK